jgi:hypothetical protein
MGRALLVIGRTNADEHWASFPQERKHPMAKSSQPSVPQDDNDGAYTVVPVIPTDYLYHTDEHPECFEPDCDCHQQRIADLSQAYRDGLVSTEDATRIAGGKTV